METKETLAESAGTVYLIHFASKYHHSAHYVGWAKHLKRRISHHRQGTGARLLQVLGEKGIDYDVVRVWRNKDRNFERYIKNQKNVWRYCPVCSKDRTFKPIKTRTMTERFQQYTERKAGKFVAKVEAESDREVLEYFLDEGSEELKALIQDLVKEDAVAS